MEQQYYACNQLVRHGELHCSHTVHSCSCSPAVRDAFTHLTITSTGFYSQKSAVARGVSGMGDAHTRCAGWMHDAMRAAGERAGTRHSAAERRIRGRRAAIATAAPTTPMLTVLIRIPLGFFCGLGASSTLSTSGPPHSWIWTTFMVALYVSSSLRLVRLWRAAVDAVHLRSSPGVTSAQDATVGVKAACLVPLDSPTPAILHCQVLVTRSHSATPAETKKQCQNAHTATVAVLPAALCACTRAHEQLNC